MVPNKITPNFSSAFILIWFQWILNVIPWYWSPYLLTKASTLIKYDHAICGINHLKWFSDPLEWHPLANNFCHTTALNVWLFISRKNHVLFSRYLHLCLWWILKLQSLWSHYRHYCILDVTISIAFLQYWIVSKWNLVRY